MYSVSLHQASDCGDQEHVTTHRFQPPQDGSGVAPEPDHRGDVAVGRDDEEILAEERAGGGQADRLRSDVHG